MFVLIISQSSPNIRYVGSKIRSLGQISLKSYVPSRCHSFARSSLNMGRGVKNYVRFLKSIVGTREAIVMLQSS